MERPWGSVIVQVKTDVLLGRRASFGRSVKLGLPTAVNHSGKPAEEQIVHSELNYLGLFSISCLPQPFSKGPCHLDVYVDHCLFLTGLHTSRITHLVSPNLPRQISILNIQ